MCIVAAVEYSWELCAFLGDWGLICMIKWLFSFKFQCPGSHLILLAATSGTFLALIW